MTLAEPTQATTARLPVVSTKGPRWDAGALGNVAIKVLSALTLIGIWYLGSAFIPAAVLPAPHEVVVVLWQDMLGPAIWRDVGASLTRIALAFSLAMSIAVLLGFCMGLWRTAERYFDLWIICGITMPSLVLILTTYMIIGLNERAAIIGAAIPVIPLVTIAVWDGVKNVDQKLVDMARAFHAGRGRLIRQVIAPQIAPILLSSTRSGLGLVWKMVLFVELLGRSSGIGYRIEYHYQLFNMAQVLAHAILFLFIMLFLELVVLGMIEERLFRWRPVKRTI